jgi:hypothetical protein
MNAPNEYPPNKYPPNKYQLGLLRKAVSYLELKDISPYLTLRELLNEKRAGFEEEFTPKFEKYYGLRGRAGLTDDFKKRYFEILFSLKVKDHNDPHTPILKELYEFRRLQGDKALQCSFVSKLVAIHDESYPIFDKHVEAFFGISAPDRDSENVDFRIAGFVANLMYLRYIYRCWAGDNEFQTIVQAAKQRFPILKPCTVPRIADFLVWAVGHYKLNR